jgi:hypothetical protein
MLLDTRVVSRKTPLDGKLEIGATAAASLTGTEIPLTMDGQPGTAHLSSMSCTCGRAGGGNHVHHFLESPLFMALSEGQTVRVEWDETRALVSVASS